MKTWIVSSLDEENIQGEETIQGRKLYEEIRYFKTAADSQDYDFFLFIKHRYKTLTYKNWVIKKNFIQKWHVFAKYLRAKIVNVFIFFWIREMIE